MERDKNFNYGDNIYYIMKDPLNKKWTWQEGQIVGMFSNDLYKVLNTKLNLRVNVEVDKIYKHLANCQMDICFMNGDEENDKGH